MNSFAYKIYYFPEIGSTNDYALRNKDNLVFGDVIIADKQTAGHGRFDRKWVSSSVDNVYLTIVLGDYPYVHGISLFASIVLARVLGLFGIESKIKWPNDILVDNKKIAGILVQTVTQGDKSFSVLGIGLNVSLSNEEKLEIGTESACVGDYRKDLCKKDIVDTIIKSFFDNIVEWRSNGFLGIKNEYEIKSSLIAKQITVKCFQKELVGKVIGFSNTGEILIEENNKIVAVNSGEVVKVL